MSIHLVLTQGSWMPWLMNFRKCVPSCVYVLVHTPMHIHTHVHIPLRRWFTVFSYSERSCGPQMCGTLVFAAEVLARDPWHICPSVLRTFLLLPYKHSHIPVGRTQTELKHNHLQASFISLTMWRSPDSITNKWILLGWLIRWSTQ